MYIYKIMNKLKLWWKFEGRFIPRDILWGVKKLFYWLPIILRDRDWDHYYILEILKHKLKAQSRYIGNSNRFTTSLKESRNILICANLIDKIQEGFYDMEWGDYTDDEFSFEKIDSEFSELIINNKSENLDEFFKKYPLIYKRVLNGEGVFPIKNLSEFELKKKIAMNISHINEKRAWDLLFKIMQENMRSWWD